MIVDDQEAVHAVWITGMSQIYYARRSDTVWTTPEVIFAGNCDLPSIAVDSGGQVHVSWLGGQPGGDRNDIYYLVGRSGSWSAAENISQGQKSTWNDIIIDGDDVPHVAWDTRREGPQEIFHALKEGGDWVLTNVSRRPSSDSAWPDMAEGEVGTLHVVWQDYAPGNWDIYYTHSAAGPGCVEDAYEPDDSHSEAGLIPVGEAQERTLCSGAFADPTDDQDWVKFTAQAWHTYEVSTYELGANVDTEIALFETDGSEITVDVPGNDPADDRGRNVSGETVFWSRLILHPSAAGEYFVRVQKSGVSPKEPPIPEGSDKSYKIKVTEVNDQFFTMPNDESAPTFQHGVYTAWMPSQIRPPTIVVGFTSPSETSLLIHEVFAWDQEGLDNFLAIGDDGVDYQWEFRQPNDLDIWDYWRVADGECHSPIWFSNLPDAIDFFAEDSDPELRGPCGTRPAWALTRQLGWPPPNEEVEIKSVAQEDLEAEKEYFVLVFVRIDEEDLGTGEFYPYQTNSQFCGDDPIGLPGRGSIICLEIYGQEPVRAAVETGQHFVGYMSP